MDVEHSPVPQESRGIYGFVLFIGMNCCTIFYALWLMFPQEWIKDLPYEPPQPYWGLAVPVYFCTALFLFAFCIYPAMHSRHDPEIDDVSTIKDKYAKVLHVAPTPQVPPVPTSVKNLKAEKTLIDTDSESEDEFEIKNSASNYEYNVVLRKPRFILPARPVMLPYNSYKHEDPPICPVSDLEVDDVCRMLYSDLNIC